MADQDYILAPATATVSATVRLEEDFNVLNSLSILSYPEERFGFSEWIMRTAAALSPERSQIHRLTFKMCFDSMEFLLTGGPFTDFLERLAQTPPETLRDRALDWIYHPHYTGGLTPPDRETLLADRSVFLNFVEQVYAQKAQEKQDHVFEPDYYIQGHVLFNNPAAMHEMINSHLRYMWDEVMASEWQRVLPMLQESVEAFQQLDLSGMTALEVVRLVTGRDLTGIWDEWPSKFIFIPSAHIGPYVTRFDSEGGQMARVVFGARLPEGARITSPALSRSELLVRLNALADDTRLMILELLTQHQELCAQDVIEMLKLSQSAASRHLRQLTATGYLIERRREVAKCYSLNPQRVDDTLRALKRFLRAH